MLGRACVNAIHFLSLFVPLIRHKMRFSGEIKGERRRRCRGTTPQGSRDCGVIREVSHEAQLLDELLFGHT